MDRWRYVFLTACGLVGVLLGGGATALFLYYGMAIYRPLAIAVIYVMAAIGHFVGGGKAEEAWVLGGGSLVGLGVIAVMAVLGGMSGVALGKRLWPESVQRRNLRIAKSLETRKSRP